MALPKVHPAGKRLCDRCTDFIERSDVQAGEMFSEFRHVEQGVANFLQIGDGKTKVKEIAQSPVIAVQFFHQPVAPGRIAPRLVLCFIHVPHLGPKSRFHGKSPQDIQGEAVDRGDACGLDILQRIL